VSGHDRSPRFELVLGEPGYPELMAQTPDPPEVLYGIGDPAALVDGVAMVGARKATPYGLAAARILAGWAAAAGYVIVSGGAIGCDQAAHRTALEIGGRTVAVMAGGADVCYPRGARPLLTRIAENGAIVSEHPWGTEPRKWTFRTRNRIIAGLCQVLVVLEASLPSGTFSTADYALDAGRTVAAVPGSIFAPECRGSNRLIRNGATPITDASELADLLHGEIGVLSNGTADLAPATACGTPTDDPVLSALRTDPMRPDDLAQALGMDIVSIARRLGVLESQGVVTRYRDGRYGPC
jgi:DNA processing protein